MITTQATYGTLHYLLPDGYYSNHLVRLNTIQILNLDKTYQDNTYRHFCHDLTSFPSVMAVVGSPEYMEEPSTKVKFQRVLSLSGCSSPLSLLGTGQLDHYSREHFQENVAWI